MKHPKPKSKKRSSRGARTTPRRVQREAAPAREQRGTRTGAINSFTDITEGKRADEALRESEERFRLIIDYANDAIFYLDLNGVIQWTSHQATVLTGKPMTELIGSSFLAVLTLASAAIAEARLAAVRRGEPVAPLVEFEFLHPNGALIQVEANITSVWKNGQVVGRLLVCRDITDRKRAQAALRESEERFRSTFGHAAIGMALVSPDGRFLQVNRALCQAVGYSESEMLATTFQTVTHPDDLEAELNRVRQMLAGEIPYYQMEKRYFHKLGHAVWVLKSVSLVHDAHGMPLYFVAHIQEIIERKRAEDMLATEKAILGMLLTESTVATILDALCRQIEEQTEGMQCSVLLLDADGVHMHYVAAPSLPESYVRDQDGFAIGPTVGSCGTAAYWRRQVIVSDIATDPLWDGYRDVGLRNGVRACWSTPIISASGKVLGTFAMFYGEPRSPSEYELHLIEQVTNLACITIERKRTEEALTLFRALIDHTNDAIEVIDPETGRFLDVNEKACLAHGYTREEYLALTVPEIDPLVAARTWEETMEENRRSSSRVFESQHRRKDGSVFPVEVNVTYIRLHRDYLLAVVRDITERKQLEAQLHQAQKMETIGRLAGGVAHDFNNLLTVISGYCHLLNQENLTNTQRNSVLQIRQAGERASLLTSQLLAFSRRQVLQPQVLNLNEVVANIVPMLQRLLGEDIELVTALAPDLGRVKVDPGQMDQVIVNLAVNARDAMPEGGTLTIATVNVELDKAMAGLYTFARPGPYVTLAVIDTGCGMDAETKARIFEPFFTTKGIGIGTGLGLSMVFGIVKQSDGFVFVDSEPGRGARFTIYLPLVAQAVAETQAGLVEAPPSVGSETILLVEDEEMVRQLNREVLQEKGYKVLEAMEGLAAMEFCQSYEGPIHLLLTDVIMPGMSGWELARRVVPMRPDMKVLYMSGYTDLASYQGVLESGIAFLQKPFTPDVLARKVREVLNAPHPGQGR